MPQEYIDFIKTQTLPRIPLEGTLDLTYRCNNNCRHCWLRIPHDAVEKNKELSFEEIRNIAQEARHMGCRKWAISGGEPMLRPDFYEIFDYITGNSSSYSINTNGTLITPKIARLLKRKGAKMVALYGATAKVHNHITRNPGSFEATMRGFSYLKEAGAGFIVQLIPMRDNYHQFKDMVKLAQSLSKHYRVGAPWLFLSSSGEKERNAEIMRQRLPPKEVVELDKPDPSFKDWIEKENKDNACYAGNGKYLFSSCIQKRHEFHIDPYGRMTFCCFIKDPSFRYDLRKGTLQDCWEKFIPSLANKIRMDKEYKENCGSCELKENCRLCPVYAYLEHRRFSAKIDYLCSVARENKKFKDNWQENHRRYFRIGGITIQVESDLPFNEKTFHGKFKQFEVKRPKDIAVTIRHHFALPDLDSHDLGKEVYRKPPWAIYKKQGSWIYLGISPGVKNNGIHRVAVFNHDHTRARIYNNNDNVFLGGNLQSATLFTSDQILLARILADKEGCYLHSCGVSFKKKGLLFAGNSSAGKSTIARMLTDKAEILCDDRIIIRKAQRGFKIYGTWSHGDVPDVSANSASLRAILFLKKSKNNFIKPLNDKKEITRRLLSCTIKPLTTADWWDKTLSLVEKISDEVPCFMLYFDKTGKVAKLLEKL